MGNIRLSFTKNGSGAAVIEESNFYPYGMKQESNVQTNSAYNYEHSGKEFQKETGWSDFGARMYMADIGRWGVIDPLAEISRRASPYNYTLNNPVMFVDPDGRRVIQSEAVEGIENIGVIANMTRRNMRITKGGDIEDGIWSGNSSEGGGGGSASPTKLVLKGLYAQLAFDQLKKNMDGQLNLTFEDGIVKGTAVEGAELSEAAQWLLLAINDPKINVNIETIEGFYFYDPNAKKDTRIEGDGFRGSFEYGGKLTATNVLSPDVSAIIDILANSPIGTTPLHAVLEAYIGAVNCPDSQLLLPLNKMIYQTSHDSAIGIDKNYKDLPENFGFSPGLEVVNGKIKSYTPFYYDVNTKEVLYQFKTYKYSK